VDSQANNVDNAGLKGILDVGGVTAADIKAGKFDGSRVYVFVCNWSDLSMGVIKMPGSGVLGKITVAPRAGVYEFELNGLAYFLRTRIGELYTPTCRVDLFSRRCRLDESTEVQHAVLESVTSRNIFTIKSASFPAFSDTPIPITNHSFESGVETNPNITGWLAEESQILTQWWTQASAGAPDGANRLVSTNGSAHDADREFRILSDGGAADPGGEFQLGLAFLDASGDEICRAQSRRINLPNHGFDVAGAHADYTRRFVVPPLTRDIRAIFSIYRGTGVKTDFRMDNVRATIKPLIATALGTDRDAVSLPDWFDHGLVIFRSGVNQGVAREIESYVDGTSTMTVFFSLPFTPAVDDVIEIYPGCKKAWTEHCAQKWDNGINFQGEPFVPSQDEAFDSVNAK
jgi:hypothetical protein